MRTLRGTFERHLTETCHGYVHTRTHGPACRDASELLLLHQVPASSRIWAPVMEELSHRDTIAPDALNLGESDRTENQLTLEEHATALWQVTQALRPGPKILVGHHTGAALAAIIAQSHPDEVEGTMLIGYPYYSSWEEKLSKYARLNPAILEDDGRDLLDVWNFIRRAFNPGADRDLIFEAFADRMRAGRVWYEGYVALWNADLNGVLKGLKNLQAPTQVVAPDRDTLSTKAKQVAQISGADLIECEGGAFMLTEAPSALAAIIDDFARVVVR